MPIKNSHFRIVKREKDDPHGVEGFFLHELFVNPQGKVTSWRAGISLGGRSVEQLQSFYTFLGEAFKHPFLNHKELTSGTATINIDTPQPSKLPRLHTHQIDPDSKSPLCHICGISLCGKLEPSLAFVCTLPSDHSGFHRQDQTIWPDSPDLRSWPKGLFKHNLGG
jgi:hypothetical protein